MGLEWTCKCLMPDLVNNDINELLDAAEFTSSICMRHDFNRTRGRDSIFIKTIKCSKAFYSQISLKKCGAIHSTSLNVSVLKPYARYSGCAKSSLTNSVLPSTHARLIRTGFRCFDKLLFLEK